MVRKKQPAGESVKRVQILKMAGKMFLEEGYSEVSMDALAEAVPVSKRTLYNHFRDKRALFIAVMQERCQQVFDKFERTLKDGDRSIEQTLTLLGEQFLNVVFEPDAVNIYRTAITQAQHFPQLGKLFFDSGPSRSSSMLAAYLGALHKKGILDAPNPELSASVFLSMLTGRMQMRCLLGLKKKVSAQEKKEILRHGVRVFLYGQLRR